MWVAERTACRRLIIHGRPRLPSPQLMTVRRCDCCHTFGLSRRLLPRSLMEFAGRCLISLSRLLRHDQRRLNRPRSYQSCHHLVSAYAIGGGSPFEVCRRCAATAQGFPWRSRPAVLLSPEAGGAVGNPCSCRHLIIGFIYPIVHEQRPKGSRILVRQCHRGHIFVPPRQQFFEPGTTVRSVLRHANNSAGPVNQ